MKNKFLVFWIILSAFSCSNESKIKSEVKEYVNKNFNDPKSFELVALEVVDTLKSNEVAMDMTDVLNEFILKYENQNKEVELKIKQSDSLNIVFKTNDFDKIIANYKEIIKTNSQTIKEYADKKTFYKKYLSNENVFGYIVSLEYRANNKLGALILDSTNAMFDKKLNLISFEFNTSEYEKMINKQ